MITTGLNHEAIELRSKQSCFTAMKNIGSIITSDERDSKYSECLDTKTGKIYVVDALGGAIHEAGNPYDYDKDPDNVWSKKLNKLEVQ